MILGQTRSHRIYESISKHEIENSRVIDSDHTEFLYRRKELIMDIQSCFSLEIKSWYGTVRSRKLKIFVALGPLVSIWLFEDTLDETNSKSETCWTDDRVADPKVKW